MGSNEKNCGHWNSYYDVLRENPKLAAKPNWGHQSEYVLKLGCPLQKVIKIHEKCLETQSTVFECR